jgi:hypothetical protein
MPLLTGGQEPLFVDGPDIWKELLDSKFDPRRTVYLPSAAALVVQAKRQARSPSSRLSRSLIAS